MCYSILSLIPMKNCVHGKRANFIKLSNGYIPFGSAELFLYPGEYKFLHQRLLEKFVPWEDGSYSTVEVKNKKRRKFKRTAVSDAVTNEDVYVKNIKENLSDVKRQNLEFKPPQTVVGMYNTWLIALWSLLLLSLIL